MRRAFTTREKILLIVLAVLIIGIVYFKLLLEPINDSIDQYQMDMATEQDEIVVNTVKLAQMEKMEAELEKIYASGDAKPLPEYDNSDEMLIELNSILSRADDYSLSFSSVYALEDSTYIMCRPVLLKFEAKSYSVARAIIDLLHDSDNVNQISDISLSFDDEGVDVTLNLSYFELTE